MRVLAISDLHLDYPENAQWLSGLDAAEYKNDVLILAGDISDSLSLIQWCFKILAGRFHRVLYVPGNHDLWVIRDKPRGISLDKFQRICDVAADFNISTTPFHCGRLSIVPLFGWYDYSFGAPSDELQTTWMDYSACSWPPNFGVGEIASYFTGLNDSALQTKNEVVISFSHFLPRIDIMPNYVPLKSRLLYPVLGTTLLEQQIRRLRPAIHVYGHSHINRRVVIDGIAYVNNAYGYPTEVGISAKGLLCIWQS